MMSKEEQQVIEKEIRGKYTEDLNKIRIKYQQRDERLSDDVTKLIQDFNDADSLDDEILDMQQEVALE